MRLSRPLTLRSLGNKGDSIRRVGSPFYYFNKMTMKPKQLFTIDDRIVYTGESNDFTFKYPLNKGDKGSIERIISNPETNQFSYVIKFDSGLENVTIGQNKLLLDRI